MVSLSTTNLKDTIIMNDKKPYLHLAIQFGIILAVLRVLFDVTLKFTDASGALYFSSFLIGTVLELILIFYAIKSFRDKINNGLLSMSEAIKIGLIMMIITGAFMFVSMTFIEPNYVMEKTLVMIQENQPDSYEETLEAFEDAAENPRYLLAFGSNLMKYMFIGLVLSAIGGAIFKKEQDLY